MDSEAIETKAKAEVTEVEAFYRRDPGRVAAHVRPKVTREESRWRVGEAQTGITGTGWTLEQAIENWEANYREATTAQQ